MKMRMWSVFAAVSLFSIGNVGVASSGESPTPATDVQLLKVVRGADAYNLLNTMRSSGIQDHDRHVGVLHLNADAISCSAPVTRNPRVTCTITEFTGTRPVPGELTAQLHQLLLRNGARVAQSRLGVTRTLAMDVKCSRVVYPNAPTVCTFEVKLLNHQVEQQQLTAVEIDQVHGIFERVGLRSPEDSREMASTRSVLMSKRLSSAGEVRWTIAFNGRELALLAGEVVLVAPLYERVGVVAMASGDGSSTTAAMVTISNEDCTQTEGWVTFKK